MGVGIPEEAGSSSSSRPVADVRLLAMSVESVDSAGGQAEELAAVTTLEQNTSGGEVSTTLCGHASACSALPSSSSSSRTASAPVPARRYTLPAKPAPPPTVSSSAVGTKVILRPHDPLASHRRPAMQCRSSERPRSVYLPCRALPGNAGESASAALQPARGGRRVAARSPGPGSLRAFVPRKPRPPPTSPSPAAAQPPRSRRDVKSMVIVLRTIGSGEEENAGHSFTVSGTEVQQPSANEEKSDELTAPAEQKEVRINYTVTNVKKVASLQSSPKPRVSRSFRKPHTTLAVPIPSSNVPTPPLRHTLPELDTESPQNILLPVAPSPDDITQCVDSRLEKVTATDTESFEGSVLQPQQPITEDKAQVKPVPLPRSPKTLLANVPTINIAPLPSRLSLSTQESTTKSEENWRTVDTVNVKPIPKPRKQLTKSSPNLSFSSPTHQPTSTRNPSEMISPNPSPSSPTSLSGSVGVLSSGTSESSLPPSHHLNSDISTPEVASPSLPLPSHHLNSDIGTPEVASPSLPLPTCLPSSSSIKQTSGDNTSEKKHYHVRSIVRQLQQSRQPLAWRDGVIAGFSNSQQLQSVSHSHPLHSAVGCTPPPKPPIQRRASLSSFDSKFSSSLNEALKERFAARHSQQKTPQKGAESGEQTGQELQLGLALASQPSQDVTSASVSSSSQLSQNGGENSSHYVHMYQVSSPTGSLSTQSLLDRARQLVDCRMWCEQPEVYIVPLTQCIAHVCRAVGRK